MRISVTFILGWFLVTIGGLFRLLCYVKLGRFFTFELAIRQQHKLITDGPYAWVRHPSYTSVIALFIGGAVCMFGPGSWFWQGGWVDSVGGSISAMLFVASTVQIITSFFSRMKAEDMMLKREFGTQWDDWKRRVPYRLVPGIY